MICAGILASHYIRRLSKIYLGKGNIVIYLKNGFSDNNYIIIRRIEVLGQKSYSISTNRDKQSDWVKSNHRKKNLCISGIYGRLSFFNKLLKSNVC